MKPLLAIVTCNDPKFRARAQAQRETWVPTASQFDVKFFVGKQDGCELVPTVVGEVALAVGDGYENLPSKVQAVCIWALESGYDSMFKTDDDSYVVPEHLAACTSLPHDYVGKIRFPTGGYPAPYSSGFGYWLSRRAMEIIADAQLTKDQNEDRWVGNTLASAGIHAVSDNFHYRRVYPPLDPISIWRKPSVIGFAAVFAEYPPELIRMAHKHFTAWGKGYRKSVRKPRFDLVVYP
jgi:hypothetical protein